MIKSVIRFLSSFLVTYPIEERKSEVSGKLEILYTNGKYVLDTARVNYSFGGLHRVFQKAFSQFRIKDRKIKNVLILGFGGGSVASILQGEYGKDIEITGVEKDEMVIELAKKYFSLDKYKKLSLHSTDAYDFVQNSSLTPFDLVVVDIFVDPIIPEKFQDENFLSALSKVLSPEGILFYNFIARDEKTRDKGAHLYKQMNNLIGHTEWIRLFARSTENWVFVCDKIKTPK
ncbi:MAG: methyltransferase domain-containing protein [Bacteroidetes bacterium]|nr:methyltransferase domain-containing protein [Bacteroidota bacterium]